MSPKCIVFIKKSDFLNIDDYYKNCWDNVILEIYVMKTFYGNVGKFNDCIWYCDDIDESNHYERIEKNYY
jgi:hypothetical protein